MKHSQSEKWEDLWQNTNGTDDNGHNLYVSNLAFSVTARDLKKVFEKVGSLISANVILNPENGESRGYGFVDYVSLSDRERARRDLHGKEIFGKKIRVSRSCGKCTLYVGNLPSFINDIAINSESEKIIYNKLHEISKGIPIRRIRKRKNYNYGFVEYENHRQAQAALINLRNAKWNDQELRVEIATSNIKYDEYQQILNDETKLIKGPKNGQDNEKRRTLYIKNLDKSTTDYALKSLFEKYGKLTRCLIIRDVPSRKLNYGFIQFESVPCAEKAYYDVHGDKLNGITLHIEFSKSLPGERKKRLINTDSRTNNHMYSRSKMSQNDERNKNLHFNLRSRSVSRSRSRSRTRSRSSDGGSSSHSVSPSPRDRQRHRLRHRRHRKYHKKRRDKDQMKHEREDKIPMTTTTTINSNSLRNREKKCIYPKYPLCVNLPIEYNMNHNKHLIGFDINQQRYILFKAYKTSSCLDKLQSDSRRSRSRSRKRGRTRRRERVRNRDRRNRKNNNERGKHYVNNSKSPSKSGSSLSPSLSSSNSRSRSKSHDMKRAEGSRSRSRTKSQSVSKEKENVENKENKEHKQHKEHKENNELNPGNDLQNNMDEDEQQ